MNPLVVVVVDESFDLPLSQVLAQLPGNEAGSIVRQQPCPVVRQARFHEVRSGLTRGIVPTDLTLRAIAKDGSPR